LTGEFHSGVEERGMKVATFREECARQKTEIEIEIGA
jgi:hypothetical protein